MKTKFEDELKLADSKSGTKRLVVEVSTDLWLALKRKAADKGQSMQGYLHEALFDASQRV